MCGIIGVINNSFDNKQISRALKLLTHRGPDMEGIWRSPSGKCILAHKRLSILDLSEAGRQPMSNPAGNYWIVLNGEIYNYLELKRELDTDYKFRTHTDTEVLLRAYEKWGIACLDKLIGMFAFIVWDEQKQIFFAARDRFGVKPFYYTELPTGEIIFSSEIEVLHTMGLSPQPDPISWATYLKYGLYDHTPRTFWNGVQTLPAGHALLWKDGQLRIWKWYDLAERVVRGELDIRPEKEVAEEYRSLLESSVRFRFRSDVPIGVNLSGGLDSSILLWIIQRIQGPDSDIKVFTFATGDARYDELPWVRQMLAGTKHPHHVCWLKPEEVPELARKMQRYQYEPFGGIPTLAYSKVFEVAKKLGVIVLLDGQGLDEQWAGYDYYESALNEGSFVANKLTSGLVQGTRSPIIRPECLVPEFKELAESVTTPSPFSDSLRNLQYTDIKYIKMPRALRFNDRISMMHSRELREPFLDHRLFELAFRQPTERKIYNGVHKCLLRNMMRDYLPEGIINAPKRALQTPQREWLRGALKDWADSYIHEALLKYSDIWLDKKAVLREWKEYCSGNSDNSFYVFQWINIGLWCELL